MMNGNVKNIRRLWRHALRMMNKRGNGVWQFAEHHFCREKHRNLVFRIMKSGITKPSKELKISLK